MQPQLSESAHPYLIPLSDNILSEITFFALCVCLKNYFICGVDFLLFLVEMCKSLSLHLVILNQ